MAAEDPRFAQLEPRRGLAVFGGAHVRYVQRAGWGNAMYHLLRADEFDAQRALARMHYIDEGEGEPIVFVHGNPAWSFEFRHPVRKLRSEFRCIALDHIGFGLSSRSARREDHRPRSHAQRLAGAPTSGAPV